MARRRQKILKPLGLREVTIFRLANRRGYAAIARNNLTEGRSAPQAYSRLVKACKRTGWLLPVGKIPARIG